MAETDKASSIAELAGGAQLRSIHAINQLPLETKERIYQRLIPNRLFTRFSIDPLTFLNTDQERVIDFITPRQAGFAIIEMRRHPEDKDCIFFLEMADTPLSKVEITFLIVNDPDSPRFDIDRDEEGRRTKFGTARRNPAEEARAMRNGLAPGQIRKGLGVMHDFMPELIEFVHQMRHDVFLVEPLAYHSAIAFEQYGFNYLRGQKKMDYIQREFQPGGELFDRLDGSTPFRQPGAERTIRGRSWAIHDGILGEPWRDVEMYRSVDRPARISTFPGGEF